VIGKHGGQSYRDSMAVEIVETENAPKAIGPYSQAVVAPAGKLVFCSGQIPLDPRTGEMAGAGDVRQETHQVMRNLEAVLKAAGASLASVVKTTIYLVDMGDFAAVNEAYGSYFPTRPPARATVQVAALPRGAQVEIDAIAAAE
jgi:2-iminobutanoate/2-iminopropanoate deaminase